MLFTDDELASYPGVPADSNLATVALLRRLVQARVYKLLPAEVADQDDTAKGIALEAVTRALRNSDGYASENLDDYAYRRSAGTADAGIYLTASEQADLTALNPTARSAVRSLRLRSASQR
jgi:hypothetical protein